MEETKAIDGVKIAEKIWSSLKSETEKLEEVPSFGILCVGEDPASLSFLKLKKKYGEEAGFKVNLYYLSGDSQVEEIKSTLLAMQTENNSGVLLQLPLPERLRQHTDEILESIDPKKDVDVINKSSTRVFTSPIVKSLQKVVSLDHKKIAIVGVGRLIGQPIRDFCSANGYEYVEVHKGEYEKILNCDVVVSGIGKAHAIGPAYIKEGSVLVDYGWDKIGDTVVGDFHPDCYLKCSKYTPVPGCMGPLVVVSLFENVLQAFKIKGIIPQGRVLASK